LELAGKSLKAVNGWATFRVLRAGNHIGTLVTPLCLRPPRERIRCSLKANAAALEFLDKHLKAGEREE
jgi:hypothetical protein